MASTDNAVDSAINAAFLADPTLLLRLSTLDYTVDGFSVEQNSPALYQLKQATGADWDALRRALFERAVESQNHGVLLTLADNWESTEALSELANGDLSAIFNSYEHGEELGSWVKELASRGLRYNEGLSSWRAKHPEQSELEAANAFDNWWLGHEWDEPAP